MSKQTDTIAKAARFLRQLAAHLEDAGMPGQAGNCSITAKELEALSAPASTRSPKLPAKLTQAQVLRLGRTPSATYVIRWADGQTTAMSFWSDKRSDVLAQTAPGRALCLAQRPGAPILVEYVRERLSGDAKAAERAAPNSDMPALLDFLPLLSAPVWGSPTALAAE